MAGKQKTVVRAHEKGVEGGDRIAFMEAFEIKGMLRIIEILQRSRKSPAFITGARWKGVNYVAGMSRRP